MEPKTAENPKPDAPLVIPVSTCGSHSLLGAALWKLMQGNPYASPPDIPRPDMFLKKYAIFFQIENLLPGIDLNEEMHIARAAFPHSSITVTLKMQ